MKTVVFFAVALMLVASCGRSPIGPGPVSQLRPPPLPPPPPIAGPTTLTVAGTVRYVTGRVCEGCMVEVIDGASAAASVLTGADGGFSLSISIDGGSSVTLRASQNGYHPATQTSRGGFVAFTLESLHPLDLAGTHTMTFEASAQCTGLPESVRKREYVVTLAGHPQRPQSVFVARPVVGTFDAFELTWRVSNNEVMMVAASGDAGEIPGIVERLGSDERVELYVFSRSEETTDVTSIRVRTLGGIDYCRGNACTSCQSQQHQVTITRR